MPPLLSKPQRPQPELSRPQSSKAYPQASQFLEKKIRKGTFADAATSDVGGRRKTNFVEQTETNLVLCRDERQVGGSPCLGRGGRGGRGGGGRAADGRGRGRGGLRGDEGAEVAAGVAQGDGGAAAEGGLPKQRKIHACGE